MPLGAGNIVQSDSGDTGVLTPSSVDVTLGSATTGGAVLIGVVSDATASPPAGFVQDAFSGLTTSQHYVFRKQASTAETVFTVTFSTTTFAAWWVAEVTGLDPMPLLAGISNQASPTSSISTGTTPAVTTTDIMCIASYGAYNNASTTITFSGETNSFTEIEDTSMTSGTYRMAVAVAYRFPAASGTFETTATLSASTAEAAGILVVYGASAAPVTVIDDVTVGGTFGLTALVTARAAGDTSLDLYTEGTTVQGAMVLHSDLSVTGTMNYGTDAIGVTASTVTFAVGDVVQSDATGECMVVRDAWTDDGPHWSNTTTRATIYTTSGWTVIGSASLN